LVDITAYKDAAGVPTSRIVYSMDITDRKRSEAALLTSERRFHDIVEASADWVWEIDADCRYTYVSESVEAILGFAPDEVIGRTPFDLMPPDEADRVAPAFAAILARKAPFRDLDNINRHKDGRLLHMQTNGTPIVDQKGEVVGYRGLDRDVTPQKLAEAGLRESQQRLRMLVTAIPDLVWLKDPNGIYLACNARFEQFFGAREAEIVGKTDHDFIPRELADFFRANDLAAIAAGGPVINEEEVAFASDGHRELLQTIKTPIFDDTGRVLGVLGISRDIAQIRNNERELDDYRKHLEQMVSARTAEVEAAKNRTQLILDSSAEGLIGLDHLGNVTLCNPSALAMLGYELEDLLGRNVHAALHCKPFDREAHAVAGCAILRAIQDGRAIRVDHDTFWDVHGNPVSVSAAAHPIIEDGRCVGGVMNFQNISDRLKAETAREEAKLAAERLAKSKSEFLANMSHEIRTPLNGVLGMAQIGYRDNAGRGKAQETFARILDSGRLLLTIINDILDFSKIEAGKLEMETVPLAPADLVDDAISTMSAAAAAKGLGLVGEKLPELPTACLGDPVRIAQILLNLLANAVKFTAQGEVRLSASREGDSLVFRVTDSGIGISPEQIERLFIPFEQADSSTTRKFGGTGLGLAISRRLAEGMGGTLTARSAAGRGSAFTLRLPLKETEQPVARRAVTQDACENRLSGLRILAAEDNEVNQLVLEDFLTREGAEVRMVGNGRLAVEAVERGDAFDVVLMDIQMPEMDGLEATKKIRRIAPTLPVIGQTAHALKEEHQRSLAAGMVATITKPIDIEMLVTTVLGHVRVLGTGPTMPALVVDSEAPPVQQAIEWDVLARRYPSRPQFVDRLVAMAIQGHEKDAEKLRELVRAGNLPEIGKFAHNLKGLAGNLCAPELAREAVRVMHTAGAGSPEALTQSQDLADAVERLLSELHKRRAA
jgi:PAS domain S-box-containing protein